MAGIGSITMASPPARPGRRSGWIPVALACLAGAVAALVGGVVEDALDRLFVGVPLLLLALAAGWRVVRRRA